MNDTHEIVIEDYGDDFIPLTIFLPRYLDSLSKANERAAAIIFESKIRIRIAVREANENGQIKTR